MWFKNLRVFRLQPQWQPDINELASALEEQGFQPAGSQDMQVAGWVAPAEHTGLVHAQNGQLLLKLRIEKKLLPATVVNQFVARRAQDIEDEQGWRPGRRQLKEIKEQITTELLPKAFSIARDTAVWIDTRHHWLVVDAAAVAPADQVMHLLSKVLQPFPIMPWSLTQSPASVMTSWLLDSSNTGPFTIDQDAELRATDDTRATVRFVRHSIDEADVKRHIDAGKRCTRLGLTWADRLSFVLTDALEIKRLTPLDILTEDTDGQSDDAAEQFDADFTLMSSEVSAMLTDLSQALGGEQV